MIFNAFRRCRLCRKFLGAAALPVALFGLVGAGCAVQPSAQNVDLFVQRAPLPVLVAKSQVIATAERTAALHEGDFVLHGVGASMEPVYLPGTAVVVHPTAFHMLRKGMPVVYTNQRGAYVAHMLVEKTSAGW